MIVKKDIKKYIGAIESEEEAARYYDKYALIIQGFDVSYLLPLRSLSYRLRRTSPTPDSSLRSSFSPKTKRRGPNRETYQQCSANS